MLQQHRRHCRGGSDRFGTASGSDFGSVVPAFNGAGAWNKRACVKQLMRYIPVQSIKIVIVAWQIVVQVRQSVRVNFVENYKRMLSCVHNTL
ncbi:unnamed protein product [Ascophyllum nodosum]